MATRRSLEPPGFLADTLNVLASNERFVIFNLRDAITRHFLGDSFAAADTLASIASGDYFLQDLDSSPMQKPKIDDKLTLLTDFGKTEAICAEVLDDPATAEGILLKVMARGPFQEGQQCWILDRDGSKIGATVESVFKQTIDSEVTLSTVLPA